MERMSKKDQNQGVNKVYIGKVPEVSEKEFDSMKQT